MRPNGEIFFGALAVVLASTFTINLFSAENGNDPFNKQENFFQHDAKFPLDSEPVNRKRQDRVVSFADVLEEVTPAVVGVHSSRLTPVDPNERIHPLEQMLRRYYGLPPPVVPRVDQAEEEAEERMRPEGMGSGIIVSSDGYILTNHHVITDSHGNKADQIEIKLPDGRKFLAELVGSDGKTDVAVLKVEAKNLPFLSMADSDHLKVGDIVFAVGNPLEVGLTVTMGIVSATGRSDLNLLGLQAGYQGYEDFIQTDAPINPGDSGGALVDTEGRLIGVNAAILSRTGGSIGIGFAIPIKMVRDVMLSLIETGAVQRGFLGLSISDLDPDLAEAFGVENANGALVEQVEEELPAAIAGIKRGDVIVALGKKKVSSASELRLAIASTLPGSTVTIKIIRKGETEEIHMR